MRLSTRAGSSALGGGWSTLPGGHRCTCRQCRETSRRQAPHLRPRSSPEVRPLSWGQHAEYSSRVGQQGGGGSLGGGEPRPDTPAGRVEGFPVRRPATRRDAAEVGTFGHDRECAILVIRIGWHGDRHKLVGYLQWPFLRFVPSSPADRRIRLEMERPTSGSERPGGVIPAGGNSPTCSVSGRSPTRTVPPAEAHRPWGQSRSGAMAFACRLPASHRSRVGDKGLGDRSTDSAGHPAGPRCDQPSAGSPRMQGFPAADPPRRRSGQWCQRGPWRTGGRRARGDDRRGGEFFGG